MGRAAWLGSMILMASCVRSELVPCDNGLACPVGLVCDEVHASCVTPEQIASCAGAPDLTPCPTGVCRDEVCLPVGCGNARVDPGEACDDGNLASADGCSADCASTEQCGNGRIDPLNSEVCDGGDLVNHDGCDSRCRFEEPAWTPLVQVPHPQREQSAYAFDEQRRRLVVFGGFDATSTRQATTLEWNGVRGTWVVRSSAVSPTDRFGAAMAYDSERGVSVLFGGYDGAGYTDDTWMWDGETWTPIPTPMAPPGRTYHAMVYDSRRHRMIVFGGRSTTGVEVSDTWAFDGTTWTELSPASSPPARERMSMAYDPLRDQVVLVGGVQVGGLTDTWVFEGTTWTQGMSSNARFAATLTFDPIRGGLVLVGGAAANPTLFWNGSTWQVIGATSGTPFGGRSLHVAYFDPERGAIVAGLGRAPAATFPADMQELGASAWTPITADPGPVPLDGAMMAYDARRGRLVVFGGHDGTVARDETWENDGNTWFQRDVTPRPLPRDHGGLAYDRRRGKTVLWGGRNSDPVLWEWDGTSWTSITPSGPTPPPRRFPAMAYDASAGVIVMFGGIDGTSLKYRDTWTWDGATWTDVTATIAPPARHLHMAAYDDARHEVVMFGGSDAAGVRLDDTWTWTSSGGWVARTPVSSPMRRVSHAIATDPVRAQVILVGGAFAAQSFADAWSWDGATWTRVFTPVPPPGQQQSALGYDASRGQLILFGAAGTWRLRWAGQGVDDLCTLAIDRDGDGLNGCADPDCAGLCSPLCPSGTSCAIGPACGDATCDPLETCRLCPADCGACTPRCGDAICDPGETCPGDCP